MKDATLRRDRGQATTEFVLVVPFLLLFFFLIVDFGWLLKNWIVVTNAAREATRCAVAQSCQIDGNPVTPDELAKNRITMGITGNLSEGATSISYVEQNGASGIQDGDTVVFCVRAKNNFISPLLPIFSFVTGGALPNPLPIAAREEMRVELPDPGVTAGDGSCSF